MSLSEFYEPNALMMEEEGAVIAGLLVGLNVIDANLCMKGEDLDSQVSVCYSIRLMKGQQMVEQSIIFVTFSLSFQGFSPKCAGKKVIQGNKISNTLSIGWSHRFYHVSERWCAQQQKHRRVSPYSTPSMEANCCSLAVNGLKAALCLQWWTDHSYSWPEELRWGIEQTFKVQSLYPTSDLWGVFVTSCSFGKHEQSHIV